MRTRRALGVIRADVIDRVIASDMVGVMRRVEEAYIAYEQGLAVNPPSLFLRLPERPNSRIIALPAHLGQPRDVSGIKWIASYPDNTRRGLARASAVLILNDGETGYPYACLEGAAISAARTAASALLAAESLRDGTKDLRTMGIVGTGLIARTFIRFLFGVGWKVEELVIFDSNSEAQREFGQWFAKKFAHIAIKDAESAAGVLRASDLAFFATLASTPHVHSPECVQHAPVILHISLRDLSPEIILACQNVVDDRQHVLNAGTSVLLASEVSGNARFIDCTLAQLLMKRHTLKRDKATVFSPFGLGVLDIAVGLWIYEHAAASGEIEWIEEFFRS